MVKKYFWLILFFLGTALSSAWAQRGQVNVDSLRKIYFLADTVDSTLLAPVEAIDSITPKTLRPLDSIAVAEIAAASHTGFGYEEMNIKALIENFLKSTISKDPHHAGTPLPRGDLWVLGFIALLLVIFAVLKRSFSKQLNTIMVSFFSNRVLGNLNKEDNLFTSWPFLLLFVQLGFTIGMFFYLVAQYQQFSVAKNGFQFFLGVSALIIVLYAFKILLLRLMGFIFDVRKPVNEYVSILYLSYFNTALLFIPLVVAFALSPLKYGGIYIAIAIILLILIFVFQFIRAAINILSNYRFSKVYLFLYFCTLEICPILILIKAIEDFRGN